MNPSPTREKSTVVCGKVGGRHVCRPYGVKVSKCLPEELSGGGRKTAWIQKLPRGVGDAAPYRVTMGEQPQGSA